MTIRYTPGSGAVPEPFLPTAGFPGAVVLLVAGTAHRGWAARTAVELAAAWAHSGRRVVLADLHLEDPALHEAVGEENLEGLVDVFLYGASLARSARPLRSHGFHLVTAGTYTDDAEAVYRHPRWEKLIDGFRGAQASLVLFAPAESGVVRELGRHAADVLFLDAPAELGESVPAAARRHPPLAPPVGETGAEQGAAPRPHMDAAPPGDGTVDAAPPMEETVNAAPPMEETVDSAPPVEGTPQAAAGAQDEPAPVLEVGPPDPGDVALPPPPGPRRRRRTRGGVSPLAWIVIALTAIVFTGFLVASERPEILDSVRARLTGGTVEAAPPASPAGGSRRAVPVGDTLAHSVQIKAYNSLRAARQQLSVEQRQHRSVPFVISPELVSDILYYKIYAGMSADTAEAVRLRQRLVAAGSLDESDALGSWPLIHTTPLTFLLREEHEREVALARADSLTERGVPAYAVRVPFSDGSSRWRIYGGAFADTLRSEGMRRLLEDAGVAADLVVRIGSLEEGG